MEDRDRDTLLLQSILAEDVGTIGNIIQAAIEQDWAETLHERLSLAYFELTNKTPIDDDEVYRLREEDEDD